MTLAEKKSSDDKFAVFKQLLALYTPSTHLPQLTIYIINSEFYTFPLLSTPPSLKK